MAKLVLDRVSKQYDGKNFVVENFNLEIDRKEFVIFVGPSGCGKSTVLRMIAGLEEITTGGIYIDERPVSGKMAARGDIAMVFQNYALYPHMSVYDNIAYSLKIKGVPKKEIREKDAEIDRQSKIAGVFCKAYEKAVLLTPTEENVRIWVKCTRMTKEEMEDTIQESHELAGVFTSIAGLMEHLLPERGTL